MSLGFLLSPSDVPQSAHLWRRWVLESDGECAVVTHLLVDADSEVTVRHHSHHVPGQPIRLEVLCRVGGADHHLIRVQKIERVHLQSPETPRPRFSERRLRIHAVDLSQPPGLAIVQRHLHSDHFASATRVGISLHGVGTVRLEHQRLVVTRSGDGGVDVELIDDELGLVDPSCGGSPCQSCTRALLCSPSSLDRASSTWGGRTRLSL